MNGLLKTPLHLIKASFSEYIFVLKTGTNNLFMLLLCELRIHMSIENRNNLTKIDNILQKKYNKGQYIYYVGFMGWTLASMKCKAYMM